MFCCLGLVVGFAAGVTLSGPWAFIAPVAGFGLGLIGDLTLIRHGLHSIQRNAERWTNMGEDELRHEELKEV